MVFNLINAKNIQLIINHLKNTFDKCLTFQNALVYCRCFQAKKISKISFFQSINAYIYTKALIIE